MHNDYDSATWADRHGEVTAAIAGWLREIGIGLARLHAYQFDAPWRHHPRRRSR